MLLFAALLLVVLLVTGLDSRLKIQYYTIETEEITNPVRLALITDLHSCRYGENEQKLIAAIDAEKPDILLLGGDIFDDQIPNDNTAALLQGVAHKYPCYYVTGNHEYGRGPLAFWVKMQILQEYGVKRLPGNLEIITINGETLNICGVDDPSAYRIYPACFAPQTPEAKIANFKAQLANVQKLAQNGNYTILLSHRPEYFPLYAQLGFDLALCGHAHGGQWRLPGLINGLYAPNQGIFPKYAGGLYQQGSTTMVVSRGLARESTRIPRIFNRPELVIIDLK